MEVLVKTDNGLQRLGEGKIFSKKQLKLREDNNGLSAALGSANGLQQAQAKARSIMQTHPGVTSAKGEMGQMDSKTDSNEGEGLTMQIDKDAPAQTVNKAQQALKGSEDATVEFVDNSKNSSSSSTNESRKNRKLMEMRYNSVPFTKKELSSFLKSL